MFLSLTTSVLKNNYVNDLETQYFTSSYMAITDKKQSRFQESSYPRNKVCTYIIFETLHSENHAGPGDCALKGLYSRPSHSYPNTFWFRYAKYSYIQNQQVMESPVVYSNLLYIVLLSYIVSIGVSNIRLYD